MNPAKEKGDTHVAQQETEERSVPRTPNERDTSADSQKGRPVDGNSVGKAAHADASGDKQDTDKGPVMDEVYDKVRKGT